MSLENVEIVRALQPPPDWNLVTQFGDDAAFAVVAEGIAPHLDDDFEALGSAGVERVRHRGLEGLRAVWLEWLEPWESYRVEIEELIDAGSDVIVLTRDYGRRPGMTAEVSVHAAAVWTVRAGKVARANFYPDRAAALEAAGLRE
jgi:ketosteroid isomerase-like protein